MKTIDKMIEMIATGEKKFSFFANAMHVCEYTIRRWSKGLSGPNLAEEKYLAKVIHAVEMNRKRAAKVFSDDAVDLGTNGKADKVG